jgi:hypothetical protein
MVSEAHAWLWKRQNTLGSAWNCGDLCYPDGLATLSTSFIDYGFRATVTMIMNLWTFLYQFLKL